MFRGENKIRVKAICVIIGNNKLFVSKAYDSIKKDYYYRPLGGKVEFGEYAIETIRREIEEELNTTITNIKMIKIVENIFTCDGLDGHEIMFIFSGEFSDKRYYEDKEYIIKETSGDEFIASWIKIDDFISRKLRLVPNELNEIIEDKYKSGILTTAST